MRLFPRSTVLGSGGANQVSYRKIQERLKGTDSPEKSPSMDTIPLQEKTRHQGPLLPGSKASSTPANLDISHAPEPSREPDLALHTKQ